MFRSGSVGKFRDPDDPRDLCWINHNLTAEFRLFKSVYDSCDAIEVYSTSRSSIKFSRNIVASKCIQVACNTPGTRELNEKKKKESEKNEAEVENREDYVWIAVPSMKDGMNWSASAKSFNMDKLPVLCIVVARQGRDILAYSSPIAVYHEEKTSKNTKLRVWGAFDAMHGVMWTPLLELDAAVFELKDENCDPTSLERCWRGVCSPELEVEAEGHSCFYDMKLIRKCKDPLVAEWGQHANECLWFTAFWEGEENGTRFPSARSQRAELGRFLAEFKFAKAESSEVYCIPYFDLRHKAIMWYCKTNCDDIKRYFYRLGSRQTPVQEEDWILPTSVFLNDRKGPKMILLLPGKKKGPTV
jgi:hypothetical protein